MAERTTEPGGECPRCQRRTLLRAVVEEVKAAVAGEPRHEHPEFLVCPVCGWNDLPERWEHR